MLDTTINKKYEIIFDCGIAE